MNMRISLGDKTIITTVFVELVAPYQLLLFESVSKQLEIVNYHPSVQAVATKSTSTVKLPTPEDKLTSKDTVPLASVNLISIVRLPAYHSAAIPVEVKKLGGSVLKTCVYTLMMQWSGSIRIVVISNQNNSGINSGPGGPRTLEQGTRGPTGIQLVLEVYTPQNLY